MKKFVYYRFMGRIYRTEVECMTDESAKLKVFDRVTKNIEFLEFLTPEENEIREVKRREAKKEMPDFLKDLFNFS